MLDFLNSIWLPIIIGIIGAVYFAVSYHRANKAVNARRKEYMRRLSKAKEFSKKVNAEGNRYYYLFDRDPAIVDAEDKPLVLPEQNTSRILLCAIHPGSRLPDKGFAVAVGDFGFKTDDQGHIWEENAPLQFQFMPAAGCSAWKIVALDGEDFICRHPLMGCLKLPHECFEGIHIGEMVKLCADITSKDGCLLVTYRVLHD